MNTFGTLTPAFYGRRLTLSQACEMKSRVNTMFPYTSNWKLSHIDYYDILERHNYSGGSFSEDIIRKINEEVGVLNDLTKTVSRKLRLIRNEYTQFVKYPLEYFKKMSSGILRYKSANCGEIARLMYMVARINDVEEKDVKVLKLGYRMREKTPLGYEQPFEEVDHVILTMNTQDGEIGIDGILDETGCLEELKTRYSERYGKVFGIPKDAEIGFLPVDDNGYSTRSMPRLDDKDAEELRAMYPKLFVE